MGTGECFMLGVFKPFNRLASVGEGGKPSVTSLGSNEDLTFLLYSYMCMWLECLCLTDFYC